MCYYTGQCSSRLKGMRSCKSVVIGCFCASVSSSVNYWISLLEPYGSFWVGPTFSMERTRPSLYYLFALYMVFLWYFKCKYNFSTQIKIYDSLGIATYNTLNSEKLYFTLDLIVRSNTLRILEILLKT